MRLQADLQPYLRERLESDMDQVGHDGKRRMVSLGLVLVGAMSSESRRRLAAMLPVRESQAIAESVERDLWPVRLLAAVSALPRPEQERLTDALSHPETRQMLLDWLETAPPRPAPAPAAPPSTNRTPKGRRGRAR